MAYPVVRRAYRQTASTCINMIPSLCTVSVRVTAAVLTDSGTETAVGVAAEARAAHLQTGVRIPVRLALSCTFFDGKITLQRKLWPADVKSRIRVFEATEVHVRTCICTCTTVT